MLQKGFNSDLNHKGTSYHVQTEDWGLNKPYFVSRVFCNGAVIKSIKTSYLEVLPKGRESDQKSIRLAMRVQHEQILDLLLSGHLF